MKYIFYSVSIFFLAFSFALAQNKSHKLLQANMDNSLESTWKAKEVFDSELIDNCESLKNWFAGGEGQIELSNLQVRDGHSVKLTTTAVSNDSSNMFPVASAGRKVYNENWHKYNRISVWVYVQLKNIPFVYLELSLKNAGKNKVPNNYRKKGKNFFKVDTGKWINLLWEIPALPRDNVTELGVVYLLKGKPFSGIGDSLSVFIDQLELQKVDADPEEGWQIAPGKIAFSHTGYSTGGNKSALANNIDADEFSILDGATDKIVITQKIENISTRFGDFQMMEFSELRKEGNYRIKAGKIITRPFKISNNVWIGTIWKNLNFWRTERCGQEVDGVHENCHRDAYVKHSDKMILINGGWHDAGDLTQMIYNTGDAIYSMLDLADHLREREKELARQLTDEAKWGLDWLLKTRFGKGWRHNFGGITKWTDGIIGNGDDFTFEAKNQVLENFLSASVLAKAALFFKASDPALSDACLWAAKEDWRYAEMGITKLNVELCGTAILASVNLFELTADDIYKEKAVAWSEILTGSQRQTYPDWDIPLTGFFYKDPDKKQILRYNPIGNDQAPIVALDKLCRLFPSHLNWINWYAAMVFYAEYIKKTAELSNPFQMIPQSIYNLNETHTPSIYGLQQSTLAKYAKYEKEEPQYKQQVQSGLPLGKGNYLRTFPVWYGHRGSAGIQMAQAKGLAVASHLRNDLNGIRLAEKQLQWVVGRNPFAQSTMYGEGYDFPPLYFVSSGPIVGSIACGIQTNGNSDLPNWPASNAYTYKEIWTHTANRWLMLVQDLSGAARVSGVAGSNDGNLTFTEEVSDEKQTVEINKKGKFSAELIMGVYRVQCGKIPKKMTLLPGRDYKIDVKNLVGFSVVKKSLGNGKIRITVSAVGTGRTKFELRSFNLVSKKLIQTVQLEGKPKKISWEAQVVSSDKPWVAVVITNDDLSTREEISSVW